MIFAEESLLSTAGPIGAVTVMLVAVYGALFRDSARRDEREDKRNEKTITRLETERDKAAEERDEWQEKFMEQLVKNAMLEAESKFLKAENQNLKSQ